MQEFKIKLNTDAVGGGAAAVTDIKMIDGVLYLTLTPLSATELDRHDTVILDGIESDGGPCCPACHRQNTKSNSLTRYKSVTCLWCRTDFEYEEVVRIRYDSRRFQPKIQLTQDPTKQAQHGGL